MNLAIVNVLNFDILIIYTIFLLDHRLRKGKQKPMKNTFGNNIILTLFGEGQGPSAGIVIDGLTPGIEVNEETIREYLAKRNPEPLLEEERFEPDNFGIISGVFNGKATGAPLCIIVPIRDDEPVDYDKLKNTPRPSHADYAAMKKYHNFQDYRNDGHFSGRITSALLAAGGILIPALAKKGITVESRIVKMGTSNNPLHFDSEILVAAANGDTIGGVVKTVIDGVPAGLGEPWFDSLESLISHAVFSIGGVKGIEFGMGFAFADMTGTQANDAFRITEGKIVTSSNNNGGINGGISNGMPIVFKTAVKPSPSIEKEQSTVDLATGENVKIKLSVGNDPAIVRRVPAIIDVLAAHVITDALISHYGTDYLL